MSLRSLLLLLVGAAIVAFIGVNWSAMTVPTDLNLIFTEIRAPLGLVLLGLMALLSAVFVGLIAYTQGTVLMETRRHAKELSAQRELADKAEASRFTDLRAHLDREVTRLSESIANNTRETLSRVDRAEMGLRDRPVDLVGHSMGGNAVSLYAGVRPERVKKLINLEGIGLMGSVPQQAPKRMAKWLDELKNPPVMKGYASLEEVAARLQKTNPRLLDERAAFLAGHWSARNEAGEYEILGDPAHKMNGPLLYHLDEMIAVWKKITAPVLWIEAADTEMWRWMGPQEEMRAEVDRRLAHMASVEAHIVPEAGHMVHHDQPAVLARLIEAFLAR